MYCIGEDGGRGEIERMGRLQEQWGGGWTVRGGQAGRGGYRVENSRTGRCTPRPPF